MARGICALVALWDQTPPVTTEAKLADDVRLVDSDHALAQQLEARLPKGAMIFQLPVMDFPEAPAPGMPSYDHFRLYLHSEHLRFSFGAVKGRPWLQWTKNLGSSFTEVVHNIENYGFAAVYVNRNGFEDKGAGILQSFRKLGYTEVIESQAGDLFCVLIHPASDPILPSGKVD